jgi:hypothetical protein
MRRLRIDSEMSRRLGECGLSRNAVIRFRAGLRDDLENRYQLFGTLRHRRISGFSAISWPSPTVHGRIASFL